MFSHLLTFLRESVLKHLAALMLFGALISAAACAQPEGSADEGSDAAPLTPSAHSASEAQEIEERVKIKLIEATATAERRDIDRERRLDRIAEATAQAIIQSSRPPAAPQSEPAGGNCPDAARAAGVPEPVAQFLNKPVADLSLIEFAAINETLDETKPAVCECAGFLLEMLTHFYAPRHPTPSAAVLDAMRELGADDDIADFYGGDDYGAPRFDIDSLDDNWEHCDVAQ